MINKIRNEAQYNQIMVLIEAFIKKATEGGGFSSLSESDANELQQLSVLAEQYEDDVLKLMPLPLSINSLVLHKISELNVTQAKMAEMLGLGTSKLSQILSGKREPDLPFLKAVHGKLGISGDFLLENA
ncbi:Antitoxin component HigA of the HigAB toxin-antitoxin module, contains an N-terminal HTH domain [Pedobacter westerhofensis]|uniref:Antitoxin component HigA of the HigAB toxin-antitoxin module, contains an N-terminal HTH domain n=1 Tax=Pedobacter westerhofensis TaxID=425512 RepID=A0A521FH12_9SPHI|nr:helix-turn-helix domain-containing protein [Pedobacter westerhofensis]SMO95483.1 Antitoxin component HigA of the HigAB toxin-antitoxin module, contains an N-terminal HTH domain [Pedobacter westerhofensis]